MVRDDCKHYQPPSGWCDGDCCELRKDFFTPCENCEHYESKNKRTNADRIRAMTDEELAGLFADGNCGYCRIHDFCFAKGCQIDCEDMWLDWLKEEKQ